MHRSVMAALALLLALAGPALADMVAIVPAADAGVYSYLPNNNYGGNTRMEVGCWWTATGQQEYRSFVQFDLSSVPAGSEVDACTLRVWGYYYASPAGDYTASRVTASWIESGTGGITWNNQPGISNTNEATIAISGQGARYFDVTAVCREWMTGTSNYGLRLWKNSLADSNARTYFGTKENTTPLWRETLYVTYTPPGAAHIANVSRTPQYPLSAEPISVSAKMWVGSGVVDSALISYSNDRADWTYVQSDSNRASDSTYFFHIPPRSDGDSCHFQLHVWSGAVQTTSGTNSLKIPRNATIYAIQKCDTAISEVSPWVDSLVHVAGIVTGVQTTNRIYFGTPAGDTWGGLFIYRTGGDALLPGDSLDVVGYINEFNSLSEVDPLLRTDKNGTGRAFDTTKVNIEQALLEAYEGVVVRLDSVHVLDSTGTGRVFNSGRTYRVANAGDVDTIMLYVQSGSAFVGTPIPPGIFNLVSNCGQYGTSHQLTPRYSEDIIPIVDVQAVQILAPPPTLNAGDVVDPTLVVTNTSGTDTAKNVVACFEIGSGYRVQTLIPAFAPGDTDTLVFDPWTAAGGVHEVLACVSFAGDPDRSNDSLRMTCTVTGSGTGKWAVRPNLMPDVPSYKQLKDGGWLAWDDGTARIYASKGNRTVDFYSFNPADDSWQKLADWPRGIEDKPPSKGSVGVLGDGVIYATKGNNTQGFWLYDIERDSWAPKAAVPLGITNKKVKGGTDMVYLNVGHGQSDTDYVYMLKGYKNEFWRYNTAADLWQTMPAAPVGVNQKWDKGSWLVAQKEPGPPPKPYTLFAHKAKYHEFWKYTTDGDSWFLGPLTAMPRTSSISGKTKKATDGSCAAFLNEDIYAFKGANTQEFWRYTPDEDSWQELDTIPTVGIVGSRKKRVKAGADIVAVGDMLYATKGNKCREIWTYTPYGLMPLVDRPGPEGVMAGSTVIPECGVTIAPNPLAGGFVALRYSLPRAGTARVSVLDVAGRAMLERNVSGRSGSLSLDLRGFRAGVYLVRVTADGFTDSRKLVVQR